MKKYSCHVTRTQKRLSQRPLRPFVRKGPALHRSPLRQRQERHALCRHGRGRELNAEEYGGNVSFALRSRVFSARRQRRASNYRGIGCVFHSRAPGAQTPSRVGMPRHCSAATPDRELPSAIEGCHARRTRPPRSLTWSLRRAWPEATRCLSTAAPHPFPSPGATSIARSRSLPTSPSLASKLTKLGNISAREAASFPLRRRPRGGLLHLEKMVRGQ